MAGALSFVCGAMFAAGVCLSGMVRPSKVLGFLNLSGDWDPSLALVMGSAVVIYAPKATTATDNGFVCFEPMAGITDALNLAQKGLYRELQSIPPGQTWQESFWIRPSGF